MCLAATLWVVLSAANSILLDVRKRKRKKTTQKSTTKKSPNEIGRDREQDCPDKTRFRRLLVRNVFHMERQERSELVHTITLFLALLPVSQRLRTVLEACVKSELYSQPAVCFNCLFGLVVQGEVDRYP